VNTPRMGSPYREPPRQLACPRCGDLLEQVASGIHSCLACEGVWLARATLELAFADPAWPPGNNVWWRSELPCPECAFTGPASVMAARLAGDILVDRCADHGLARLLHSDADDLAAIQAKLHGVTPDPAALARRREDRRSELARRAERDELAARSRAAERDVRWLELEAARREAAERAEREQRVRDGAAAQPARRRNELAEARVHRLELALATARAEVARLEGELADARAALDDS